MKFKKNQFQPLQELEMPDFRQQMGPNPYPQMGQMGQMYQQQGQQPFTQMGGQQSYQQPEKLYERNHYRRGQIEGCAENR